MRKIVVALAMLAVCGCAVLPISGNYYKPTASEGYTQGYGDYNAPTSLVLKRGKDQDIIVLVSGFFLGGSQEKNNPPGVEIRLYVPVAKALTVDLSAVKVYGEGTASIGKVALVYPLMRIGQKMNVATRVFSGDTAPQFGKTCFVAEIPIVGTPPQVIRVELPAMDADGIRYPPLTVTFTYTHGWWWQYYGP